MNKTSDEIKPRTVYLLKRKNKPDDGTDIYVGSISMNLKYRLSSHRSPSSYMRKSKLYVRMLEIGLNNWEIVPLLTFTCDKKTILEFEKEWIKILNADLNKNLPVINISKKEYRANFYRLNKEFCKRRQVYYYHNNIQNKIHHCDVCDKSFGWNYFLQEHFDTLKHQYTYLNSLD